MHMGWCTKRESLRRYHVHGLVYKARRNYTNVYEGIVSMGWCTKRDVIIRMFNKVSCTWVGVQSETSLYERLRRYRVHGLVYKARRNYTNV